MRTKTSKEEQKKIEEIAWGKNIKLKEKEESKKKKGEFTKNLNENLTKLKNGADRLSDGLFGKEQVDLFNGGIDLFGGEPDIGLNKNIGF